MSDLNLYVPGKNAEEKQANLRLASDYFDAWWAEAGAVASQKCSMILTSMTPQDFMRSLFLDGVQAGFKISSLASCRASCGIAKAQADQSWRLPETPPDM